MVTSPPTPWTTGLPAPVVVMVWPVGGTIAAVDRVSTYTHAPIPNTATDQTSTSESVSMPCACCRLSLGRTALLRVSRNTRSIIPSAMPPIPATFPSVSSNCGSIVDPRAPGPTAPCVRLWNDSRNLRVRHLDQKAVDPLRPQRRCHPVRRSAAEAARWHCHVKLIRPAMARIGHRDHAAVVAICHARAAWARNRRRVGGR
jgi:hypothetical protein